MEKYLNTGIKQVISQFSKVADILNEYNIGCVPCTVGTCLLKDVVAIHNLPGEQEYQMMYRIEKAIYPDRDVKMPVFKKSTAPQTPREIRYSPPLRKLVDEHTLIKKWLGLIPAVIEMIDIKSGSDRQIILEGVDFIRSYADKFHHAKEEEILFKYFDESLEIIKTMYEDHKTARNHVKTIIEALERQDQAMVFEHLNGYKDLLTQHIKKEDEILYPWFDRNLSTRQVGELFSRFNEADARIGEGVVETFTKFLTKLENSVKGVLK
jgi:hemerythrin-like domain-containing protein